MIVKHTNPCGVASRGDLREAYRLAVVADPISAFGGIVAFNRPVDADLAREIREFRRAAACRVGGPGGGGDVKRGGGRGGRRADAQPRSRGRCPVAAWRRLEQGVCMLLLALLLHL